MNEKTNGMRQRLNVVKTIWGAVWLIVSPILTIYKKALIERWLTFGTTMNIAIQTIHKGSSDFSRAANKQDENN